MADAPALKPALLAHRVFQSDALDIHITAGELRQLTHDQLVRLALELRHRLELLEEELKMLDRQCESAAGGLQLEGLRAMEELQHFLRFFEERVLRHRLRLRRQGQAPVRVPSAPCTNEVA
jgi:hypothetical protein